MEKYINVCVEYAHEAYFNRCLPPHERTPEMEHEATIFASRVRHFCNAVVNAECPSMYFLVKEIVERCSNVEEFDVYITSMRCVPGEGDF